jgi:hypothetical protein
MGSPKELTPAQLNELTNLTRDLPETERLTAVWGVRFNRLFGPMRSNDVVLVTLKRTCEQAQRARMCAEVRESNSAVLDSARLTPRPSCAIAR